jgi:hypothetical protein
LLLLLLPFLLLGALSPPTLLAFGPFPLLEGSDVLRPALLLLLLLLVSGESSPHPLPLIELLHAVLLLLRLCMPRAAVRLHAQEGRMLLPGGTCTCSCA